MFNYSNSEAEQREKIEREKAREIELAQQFLEQRERTRQAEKELEEQKQAEIKRIAEDLKNSLKERFGSF